MYHSNNGDRPDRFPWGSMIFPLTLVFAVVAIDYIQNTQNGDWIWPALGILFVLAFLALSLPRSLQKVVYVLLIALLIATLAGGVYKTSFVDPSVGMTRTAFLKSDIDVRKRDSLYFQDPANGVTQILCTGMNQQCHPQPDAPDVLNHGLSVQPGQTVEVVFNTIGSFSVTSKTTPHMNIHIEVFSYNDENLPSI